MTVLLDVNLSPEWVLFLIAEDIEAVHWSTIGSAKDSDTTILDYAAANNMLILTQDADFGHLLARTTATRPSICLIRAGRVNPLLLGAEVVAALHKMRDAPQGNAFSVVDATRIRLTSLPFRRKTS